MSKLIDFYKQVIENVGIHVSDDGYLWTSDTDDKVLITVGGKSMVLPTKEHMDSIYGTDDEGNVVTNKVIFNPINEDIVKGDSESIKLLKRTIEARISYAVASIGELLLIVASNKDLQQNTKWEINRFLGEINKANNIGIKQLVDDKSISNWTSIYNNSLETKKFMFNLYLKKRGKYDGVDYNRLAVLSSSVYESLIEESEKKEPQVLGVKLRKKDVTIFKIIFQYIVDALDDNNTVCVGSNDTESPAFIALMSVYLKVMERTNKILKHLEFVNKQMVDKCKVNNLITVDALYKLKEFKSELVQLPNENDISRGILETESKLNPVPPANILGKQQPMPTQPLKKDQPQEEDDPVLKMLYGSGGRQQFQQPLVQPMGVNSMMQPQPMGFQQPYGQQPQLMGINSMPQQQPYTGGFAQPTMNMGGYNHGYQQPNISSPGSYYGNTGYNSYQQPYGVNSYTQPTYQQQQQPTTMMLDLHAIPYK